MCRLLGVVSQRPAPMAELVADDLVPFLALACEHSDGWGMARRTVDGTGTAIGIDKGVGRGDLSARLGRLLDGSVTDAALLHLRMATPGFASVASNTHPFGDSGAAFAHNGEFTPATALDEVIGPALRATAGGDTDSERFHLAVRRRMDEGTDPVKAVLRAADDIRALANGFVSLNCLLLTPDALLAYTEHDPGSAVVARRGADYFRLSYRHNGDTVVVASTGVPQSGSQWTPLPERSLLEVRPGTLTAVVHGV
ncbi:class II glutamine amidotransferase [Streptomyces sp. NPDC006654]|uniref:class II glutamine amidotransferase n=1 Tax=Streptomyces sp. NPDC006654 TaxID=3156897 RepID=UPI0033C6928C